MSEYIENTDYFGNEANCALIALKEVLVGVKYQHYKGDLYEVVAIGKMENNGEDMVVYKPVKLGTTTTYIRPYAEFIRKFSNLPRYSESSDSVKTLHFPHLSDWAEANYAKIGRQPVTLEWQTSTVECLLRNVKWELKLRGVRLADYPLSITPTLTRSGISVLHIGKGN